MLDTMTLTKATGAMCGSLLIFLLGSWAAETIYSTGGGHGEDHAQGYVIDTGEDDAAAEPAEDEGPDLPALFASADPGKGERVFNKCKACHVLEDGQNGVGPHLYGVVGREVGSVDGFNYSGALSEVADVWTAKELYAFLENPAGYAPGTSMGFAGLGKPEDRANVIAYLNESDGVDNIEIEAATEETPKEEQAAEAAEMEEAATEEVAEEEVASEADVSSAEESMPEERAPEKDTTEIETARADEAAPEQAPAQDESPAESTPGEGSAAEAPAEDDTAEVAAVDDAAAEDAPAGESGFAAMVASADIDAGKKVFRQCSACHSVEPGQNRVGPSMHGVVGREIASADGFRYSDALKGLEGDWTLDKLSAWLENPREFAPGNRMGYPGLKDEQDRANVIGYMQSLSD